MSRSKLERKSKSCGIQGAEQKYRQVMEHFPKPWRDNKMKSNEWLAEKVRDEAVSLLSLETTAALIAHLEGLPWNQFGTGLDLTPENSQAIKLDGVDNDGLVEWIKNTRLGALPAVVFILDPRLPCIACHRDFGFFNFDFIYRGVTGRSYFFGATIEGGVFHPVSNVVGEYDGVNRIKVSL